MQEKMDLSTKTKHKGGLQFPSILKPASMRPLLDRKPTTSDRRREVEKQFGLEIPKKHDIVSMLVNLDKNLDVIFFD